MTRLTASIGATVFASALAFSSPAEADWAQSTPEFGGAVLNCIDSVGEWGEDFFCFGFVCQGRDMRMMHVAAGGDYAGRLRITMQRGRGADDARHFISFEPQAQMSVNTGTVVETAPVSAHVWRDVMRSHTILVGPGEPQVYTMAGFENFSESLSRQCPPR